MIELAWASVLSNALVLIAYLFYSYHTHEIREALSWPDRRTFKRKREYLKVAIPAALLMEADFVSWNIV